MCSGNCVDLFIVLMNRQIQVMVSRFQLVFGKCRFVSFVCFVNILLQFIELVNVSSRLMLSRKLKLFMWFMRNVFMFVQIVFLCVKQKLISRYDIRFIVFQLKNSCRKLLFIMSISIENVNSEMYEKKCWQLFFFVMQLIVYMCIISEMKVMMIIIIVVSELMRKLILSFSELMFIYLQMVVLKFVLFIMLKKIFVDRRNVINMLRIVIWCVFLCLIVFLNSFVISELVSGVSGIVSSRFLLSVVDIIVLFEINF